MLGLVRGKLGDTRKCWVEVGGIKVDKEELGNAWIDWGRIRGY